MSIGKRLKLMTLEYLRIYERIFYYRPNFFGGEDRRGGGEVMNIRVCCISDVRNRENGNGEPNKKVEDKSSGALSLPQFHLLYKTLI